MRSPPIAMPKNPVEKGGTGAAGRTVWRLTAPTPGCADVATDAMVATTTTTHATALLGTRRLTNPARQLEVQPRHTE